ncbi:hypothetical protein U594_02765 [Staphylococcus aureus W75098]|jgi:hypothetical protein|uniref:Uncharacterized protein n=2 Tax=Staphylococcus TaxID=1279 RepID=D2J6E3_STAEP|nr:hypothetical protein SAP016A_024 [Staphylococcus epidermidis]EVB16100.1 hypothetical protein O613_02694 [Staphylococcus aureus M0572]EVG26608.1 hypothetical protein T874_02799 [Staphylococcus aureus SJOS6126]EWJ72274.1 hypothetical protein U620_02753 [Staphylococcus aureus F53388]EWJ93294.1 hypothetical protein U604_02723 [Staphylococcus aureus W92106]EWK06892.1 hypothetical protein U594_02765 [Staphylococcus aureus W75098]EYM77710.1 hypothetical protein W118_00040 [Staphylococcus aureus D
MKFCKGICILILLVFCDLLIFKRSKVWGVEHESSNNQIRIIKEEDYTDMVINQY